MSFRLVPKSPVTLNDLERRNNLNLCVISPNSVAFGAEYVVVKTHRHFLRRKCRQKNGGFSDISLTAIFAGITLSKSIKVRHCPLASENLTLTWKRCKIGGKLLLQGKGSDRSDSAANWRSD